MIRQEFDVEHYWKVIVYYNWDDDFSAMVGKELGSIGFSDSMIGRVFYEMKYMAKAVTCSNNIYHTSIILFNHHSSRKDYLNSIVHEAEHVKQAMLEAYDVEDAGEDAAYTIGYLVSRMWKIVKMILYMPERVWGY